MAYPGHGGSDGGVIEDSFTSQDGLTLFFREYRPCGRRDSFAVLCLPGLARGGRDFQELAGRLSARYRVLCPDYRGVGRSQQAADWRTYTPQFCLNDLRHLLAVAGVHQVVAVGISYGGILAAALAAVAAGAVKGVVLDDIGPEVMPGALKRVLDYVGRDYRPADWGDAVTYLKGAFPNLPVRSEERWLEVARNTFRENGGRLTVDWDTAIARPLPDIWREHGDLWPMFRSLSRVPTLAIRGALSDILNAATFERMADEIAGLVPLTVPDAGHVPDLAEPSLCRQVEAFIEAAKHSPRSESPPASAVSFRRSP